MIDTEHAIVTHRSAWSNHRRVNPKKPNRLTMPQPARIRRQTARRLSDASIPPSTEPALRPPLKWAGGKRWQVPRLRPFWEGHQHRRLVEPFCGGLAVTLSLMPSKALLNDVNPHVVNFYRWIQRGLKVTVPLANNAKTYYALRNRFNKLLSTGEGNSPEAAAIFYYLNRTGYNGLCRFNQQGGFNVPFGRYKTLEYRPDFLDYVEPFARFEFTNVDFEAIPLDAEDFVYADPPYDVEFRQYSKGGFGWDEQVRTAKWLTKHPGPVMLSNQATDRIIELYSDLGYKLIPLTAPRLISCTGDRTPAEEVLATRNL
jgi:DNA adenine methylase